MILKSEEITEARMRRGEGALEHRALALDRLAPRLDEVGVTGSP